MRLASHFSNWKNWVIVKLEPMKSNWSPDFSNWKNWVIVKPNATEKEVTIYFSNWKNWVIVKQIHQLRFMFVNFSNWKNWVIVKPDNMNPEHLIYFSNWKNWVIVNYVAPLMRSVDWNKEAFTKAVITARRSPQGERGLKSSVNSSVFHPRFRQPVTITPSIVLFIVSFLVFTIWSLWDASMAVPSFQYAGFMPDFSSPSKNSPQIQKNFSKPSDRDYPPFRFRY